MLASGEGRPRQPLIWAVTTGEPGNRGQALGLAQAFGGEIVEHLLAPRRPWSLLRADLASLAIPRLDPAVIPAGPPWPDLLVSCGRRSAGTSIAVRRVSRWRTLTVHLGDPQAPASQFDLVVPMAHDRLRGANVLPMLTSLHGLNQARLNAAAAAWRKRLAWLPRPLIGVLVGGPVRGRGFGAKEAAALLSHLDQAFCGAGLIMTTSRRTSKAARDMLGAALKSREGVWLWDGTGDNPYLAMLALCDELVVTSDSVSMISEALATDRPVRVFDIGLRGRHEQFLKELLARRLVGRLGAEPPPLARPPIDATPQVARRVGELLQTRGWDMGEMIDEGSCGHAGAGRTRDRSSR